MSKMPMLSLIVVSLLVAAVGSAAAQTSPAELHAIMARPGHISIMRHALAPFEGAPRPENLAAAGQRPGDCSSERNLDERGREQARAVGRRLAAAGLAFEHLLTSAWCRCRETADLIAGRTVPVAPWLSSFFRQPERAMGQIGEMRRFAETMPAGHRALLVTHGSFVTTLTGIEPAETEVVVVVRDGYGGVKVVARGLP
jgi:phosphohistidine phosphatase SixA